MWDGYQSINVGVEMWIMFAISGRVYYRDETRNVILSFVKMKGNKRTKEFSAEERTNRSVYLLNLARREAVTLKINYAHLFRPSTRKLHFGLWSFEGQLCQIIKLFFLFESRSSKFWPPILQEFTYNWSTKLSPN
jgi:hypothetical protein